MLDFYAECEAAKEKRFSAIGALAWRRQKLTVEIERAQRETAELDAEIAGHQTAVDELERVQRNFNSWLAIREGALTAEQVAAGIQASTNGATAEEAPAVDDKGNPIVVAPRAFRAHSLVGEAGEKEHRHA